MLLINKNNPTPEKKISCISGMALSSEAHFLRCDCRKGNVDEDRYIFFFYILFPENLF